MLPVIADSNWLLATLVQSSAALVAIIGGLLATRLVTLATERNGIERRIGQLERVAETRRDQADLASKAWLDKDADSFLADVEGAVIATFGDADFDELYVVEDNAGRTKDELRPYFKDFCERVKGVTQRLIQEHGSTRPAEWEDIRSAVERAALHSDRYLLGAIVDHLEETIWRKPRSMYDIGSLVMPLPSSVYSATHRATADRRYDETVREAETARAAQRLAEVELAQARMDLDALGRPAGMASAFRVLLGIALAGVVLPLAVMANGAYEVPAAGRIALVALFTLALAAFMRFLRSEIATAVGTPVGIFSKQDAAQDTQEPRLRAADED